MMDKEYFLQLADYNLWANEKAVSWLTQISETQWQQPIVSSFGNITDTVLHIAAAENIWQARLSNAASHIWLPDVFKGTKGETLELWLKTSGELKKFINGLNEKQLIELLKYKRLNGEEYSMEFNQVLTHVFNHSTFHRGQIIILLRQVGFTNLSSTDFSSFITK